MRRNSSAKLIFILFGVLLFSSASLAHAGLAINEIMYDLSGSDSANGKSREWIEIYNPDGNAVLIDAGAWRIYDGGANRTINGEMNFSIPAGGYVIFAGDKDTFLIDNPGYSGVVYDTGITSLNNSGATLKILDENGIALDTVTYASTQGAAGDGNSLQKISGAWSGSTPTPSLMNESISSPAGGGSSTGGGSGSTSSSTTLVPESGTKATEIKKIKVEISANSLGMVGIPVSFKGVAFGLNGDELRYGKYFWNFGDGDSRESKAGYEEKFSHIYFYPGEYNVTLQYFTNYYTEIPEASVKLVVKIISSDVIISSVGDEKDFFIELTNNTSYDADISKWVLHSDRIQFVLPKNTILGPKKKMVLSPRVTNFNIADKESLKLFNSQGEIVYSYGEQVVVTDSLVTATDSTKNAPKVSTAMYINNTKILIPENPTPSIAGADLAANLISTGGDESSRNSYLHVGIFAVFLGLSSAGIYFIRRRHGNINKADDFELIDE